MRLAVLTSLAVVSLFLVTAAVPVICPASTDTPPGAEGGRAAGGRAGATSVLINEFLPRQGTDWNGDGAINSGDEWIELFNLNSSVAVNLSGFMLDDSPGGSAPYMMPDGLLIPPSGHLLLFGATTGLGLNDYGDGVRLFNASGAELDNISYGSVRTDRSVGRLPDGGSIIIQLFPTPCAANIKDDPPVVSLVWREPEEVRAGDEVTVNASVSDDIGLTEVRLHYSLMNGSYTNVSMAEGVGLYWAKISGFPDRTRVSYFVRAKDTRGQCTDSGTEVYNVLPAISRGISINATCDRPGYRPGAPAAVVGIVTYENGSPAEGANVSAMLWGGRPLGKAICNGAGRFKITFPAPYDVGNFSIAVEAEKGLFKTVLEIPIVVLNEPNRPPEFSEFSQSPRNATSADDVMICCTVSDDSGVRAAWLAYRSAAGNFTRLLMNITGPDRFIGRVPRQPAYSTVEYYLEAWDGQLGAFYPPGAPEAPCRYMVLPGALDSGFLQLLAGLNCTECLIGRYFLASGYVRNETGAAAAGAEVSLSYEGRPQEGWLNGTTDAQGIFSLEAPAPRMPANYSVRVGCTYGLRSNFTFMRLRVWDALAVTVYLGGASVPASGKVGVTGRVLRSDGTAAPGARISLSFVNGSGSWTGEAGPDGSYNITVGLPSGEGRHTLLAAASYAGANGTASLVVDVKGLPRKAPGFGTPMMVVLAAALLLWCGHRRRAGS